MTTIETDAPNASERRKISSGTWYIRFVFPLVYLVFAGMVASSILESPHLDPTDVVFGVPLIVGLLLIYRYVIPLKNVWLSPCYLYISNFSRTISVPYSEIERVSENRWVNLHPVTITLRGESEFGRSIRFLPTRRYFAFWSSHPIVAELTALSRGIAAAESASPEPKSLVAKVPGISGFRSSLIWLYNFPPRRFLFINLGFSSLTIVSNGLALAYYDNIPGISEAMREAILYGVLPVCGCIAVTSLIGLSCKRCRERILAIHGFLVGVGVLFFVLWVLTIAVDGIPAQTGFSWTPGFMEAMVAYSPFLFCRFTLPERLRADMRLFYLPLIAGLCVVPLDIALLVRLAQAISAMMGREPTF